MNFFAVGNLDLENLLIFVLGVALILSFYILVKRIVFKMKSSTDKFSNWQFPMLLALFIESFY